MQTLQIYTPYKNEEPTDIETLHKYRFNTEIDPTEIQDLHG